MTPVFCLGLLAAALQAPAASPSPAPSPAPAGPPPAAATDDRPRVTLETSLGNITLALRPDKAPQTVANFLRYVRAGHYDGTIFHRVIPNFMIQGGGMDAAMKERPTRVPIRNEASSGLRNLRGTVAMARTNDPHSATDQFFINVRDNHNLDFGIRGAGYAAFAEVMEGMDVVDRIAAVPTGTRGGHQNVPVTAVVIRRARETKAAPAPAPAS